MSNPFISESTVDTVITVNGTIADALNDIQISLSSLTDVAVPEPTDKQVLQYDVTVEKWISASLNLIASLTSLSDCTITSPATDQILKYDGYKWINSTLSLITALSSLSDCTITSPLTDQVLQYDGSAWKNATLNLITALSSLSDCTITSPLTDEVLKYDGSKWINTTLNLITALSALSDCSVSSPSNDQILVFTAASSLNKWTPYTLSGVTFDDTNKTITVSSALSALTDVTLSSLVNGNLLIYNSGTSKWINSNTIPDNILFIKDDLDGTKKLQFQLSGITSGQTRTLTVPDYSGTIAVSTNAQTSNYALVSNGTSPSWTSLTHVLMGDVSITAVKNNDVLLYNSTTLKFSNSQLLNTINNNTRLLGSALKTFGNYPTNAGIAVANDAYFTTVRYVDNVDGNILTKYTSTITNITPSSIKSSYTGSNPVPPSISGNSIIWNFHYLIIGRDHRINVDIGGSQSIYSVITSSTGAILKWKVYGTNSDAEYNSVVLTGLDANINLTKILDFTINITDGTRTFNSSDYGTNFKYAVFLLYVENGGGTAVNIVLTTGGYITTDLVNSDTNPANYGYIIDSDPTSGYPRIQNKTGDVLGGTVNNFSFMYNEMFRRIYPVVRDKNQIVLTDGTNTTTITSTSGYPISKASDVTITSPSNGQVLQYNGTKWVNTTTSAGTTTLSGCTDVTISSPVVNQTIYYNGTKWVNHWLPINGIHNFGVFNPSYGQSLVFNGSQWTNNIVPMQMLQYCKYKYLHFENDTTSLYIPSGYAGYVVQCGNNLVGTPIYIHLPDVESLPNGQTFYVQLNSVTPNVSFYPYAESDGEQCILIFNGNPWIPTTVDYTTYKFQFYTSLPSYGTKGYVVTDLNNSNRIPLDDIASVYCFDTYSTDFTTGRFNLPALVDRKTFKFVDMTGNMYKCQTAIHQTFNNTVEGASFVLLWTNKISREYLYMGDGTNGNCICINQCVTTNPGT